MTKFRIWLYSLFEPLWLNFLSLTFPEMRADALNSVLSNTPQDQEGKVRSGDLRKVYTRYRNPQSSYRIFYLRVKYFGWEYSHALKTPDRKDEVRVAGYIYSLREIFNNSPTKAVSYRTFYRRVVHQGWNPHKALSTPPNHP